MTGKKLDERIEDRLFNLASGAAEWGQQNPEMDVNVERMVSREKAQDYTDDVKQLIRDCIEAVTPEKVHEIKADTYSAGVHDGINHAISDLEANTKELLG